MTINEEIEQIILRNKKVEADKAWETSWTRRILIATTTYIFAGVWLFLVKDNSPWLKAFIPLIGYIFSTLSVPIIKNEWLKKNKKI